MECTGHKGGDVAVDLEAVLGAGLLLGTHTPKLDEKGRLLLPAKFRPRLAPGLVMAKGQEKCVYLLPMDEFAKFYQRLAAAPVTEKASRYYLRALLSGASDEVPDKQGRITIPPNLREYAGLDRDVAVIGAGTRVELWDREAWEAYLADNAPADDDALVIPPELAI